MTVEDRERLLEFIRDVRDVLGRVIVEQAEWFDPQLRARVEAAWRELEPRFADVERGLQDDAVDRALGAVGLSGAQLELKLSGYWLARDQFRRRRTSRLLRRLLRWMNLILGSLGVAVPGAEAIKEFKEALEASAADEAPRDTGLRGWLGR